MALLLQGRGYNLRRGVHFRDGGTSACCHEGGTVAVPLACARVPRGVRPDQADRGGASLRAPGPAAERGPNEAQRALVRSRACAPRAAGRAQRRACGCALASRTRARTRDEEEVPPPPAEVSVRLRLGASLLPWVTTLSCLCQSRRGYRSLGTCSRSRGGGTINRGGTLNRTKMVQTPHSIHTSRAAPL